MPGTQVHLALAGMLAAALLGTAFDRKSVLVVLGATAFPDLDAFVSFVFAGGHRTVLHTFFIPFGIGLVLWLDTSVRSESFIRERWGHWGVRVAWVAVLSYAVAGIGADFVSSGVNPLYPLHDQFYILDGKLQFTDQRGIVQTFVDLSGGGAGSSEEVTVGTGVNPDPRGTETNPERIFPVANSGWQLLVLVVGTAVTLARFRLSDDRLDD